MTNSIEFIISNNIICSIISNFLYKFELYTTIIVNQIYTCNYHCQGFISLGQTYKKGFFYLYSETTYFEKENSYYIYKFLI